MPTASHVKIIRRGSGNNVVTVILPGYNQDGDALCRVLAPGLTHSDVLAYDLPRWGFDQKQIITGLGPVMGYNRVVVYAESAGALEAAQMLRAYHGLRINCLILNAGIGSRESLVGGRLLPVVKVIPGGLLPTGFLQHMQRGAVENSPKFDPGIDQEAARYAEQQSTLITGRQAIGELRRMVRTPPVQPGEFNGRVSHLAYMGAGKDGVLDERDRFVYLRRACNEWEGATACKAEVITPPQWADHHVPTPEKPGPVIGLLQLAIDRAVRS